MHDKLGLLEELLELAVELQKELNGRSREKQIIEEMADVRICLSQMLLHYDRTKVIDTQMIKQKELIEKLSLDV